MKVFPCAKHSHCLPTHQHGLVLMMLGNKRVYGRADEVHGCVGCPDQEEAS